MVSRRTMMAGGAGAAVLAALGYRAWDRGVFSAGRGEAFEAWEQWQGRAGEGATRPLHAAILAASAHNSQPWLFEPHEDSITVCADLSRNLGAADPFRRELYFSIGCAFQNLWRAANKMGLDAFASAAGDRLEPNPAKRSDEALQVSLIPLEYSPARDAAADPRLFDAMAHRRTNRGPYLADKPVPANSLIFDGRPTVKAVTDPVARRELGVMIVEATERFIADPEMSRDSGRWFRTGRRDIAAHRDGVTIETAGLSPAVTGMAKLLPDQSTEQADKYWLASTRDVQVATTPAYGVMFAGDRFSKHDIVFSGGSLWQFLHLTATIEGLAVQPMNAPIEMIDRDLFLGRNSHYAKDLRKIARADPIATDPIFIFRIGYAERPAMPSPRRRFEDVIRRKGFA